MDKNAFFSVSDLNTDREKANDLSVYAFKVLFKIFAAALLVMWALTPLVCFFDRTTDAIRDVLCFVSIISFLILLIGHRNVRRWHFPLLLTFTVAFGGFTCLLAGPATLAFTVPSAVACGLVTLLCRRKHQMIPRVACFGISVLTALLVFPVATHFDNGLFLPVAATVHLLLFTTLVTTVLTLVSRRPSLFKKRGLSSKTNVTFLVVGHVFLANVVLSAGFLIAG